MLPIYQLVQDVFRHQYIDCFIDVCLGCWYPKKCPRIIMGSSVGGFPWNSRWGTKSQQISERPSRTLPGCSSLHAATGEWSDAVGHIPKQSLEKCWSQLFLTFFDYLIVLHFSIWRFPKMEVSPNHPFYRIFHCKPSIVGYPHFRNPPIFWESTKKNTIRNTLRCP